MKRVHAIHARARVVVEGDLFHQDFLSVQVLDTLDHWGEVGAHCVVENPEREAADLVAEFRAVAEAPRSGR